MSLTNTQSALNTADTVSVRLTLDVTYALNGEDGAEMAQNLQRMCERAIGAGMLTGGTEAEVEEYSMEAVIRQEPLLDPSDSSEEVAIKNVLGNVAAKPFYIWANDDCSNKSDCFKEAKSIRLELFNDGGLNVHIVDADGVEVTDSEIEAHETLAKAGYFAGKRKPEVKPDIPGAFMVNDPQDSEGYAIVGDDIAALILEAKDHLVS